MELCLLSHAEQKLRAPVLQDASSAAVTNVTQCHLRLVFGSMNLD